MAVHRYGPNGGALPSRPDNKIASERTVINLVNDTTTYNNQLMKKHARKKRRQRDRINHDPT